MTETHDPRKADDPRVQTVLRVLDGYRKGDLPAMQRAMSPGVTLEAVGNNALAGTYQGVGSVLAFIAKSTTTFVAGSIEVEDVRATEEEVQVIVTGDVALLRGGTQPVGIRQRYRFDDAGRVIAIRAEAAGDQDEFDRLIGEARQV